jgi:hypothetical protein
MKRKYSIAEWSGKVVGSMVVDTETSAGRAYIIDGETMTTYHMVAGPWDEPEEGEGDEHTA